MTRRRISITATAREQIRAARRWLRTNQGNPDGLLDEIEQGLTLLSILPGVGSPYPVAGYPDMKRLYLRDSWCHIYYTATADVMVHAVWHVRRGEGPVFG